MADNDISWPITKLAQGPATSEGTFDSDDDHPSITHPNHYMVVPESTTDENDVTTHYQLSVGGTNSYMVMDKSIDRGNYTDEENNNMKIDFDNSSESP